LSLVDARALAQSLIGGLRCLVVAPGTDYLATLDRGCGNSTVIQWYFWWSKGISMWALGFGLWPPLIARQISQVFLAKKEGLANFLQITAL
jgi:hypothetical protein